MGIPANLRAVGITDDRNFEVMAKKACEGSKGSFVPLSKDDIVEIYRAGILISVEPGHTGLHAYFYV